MSKLAVKVLTASDLTFFKYHFDNNPAGKQKAINLNADVFVDKLFPQLPEYASAHDGRIMIQLSIFGPGLNDAQVLMRKIVQAVGGYKNWRLNGEFVHDDDLTARDSLLQPGDLAVLEFIGDLAPTDVRAFFLAMAVPEDAQLHAALLAELDSARMNDLSHATVAKVLHAVNPVPDHPLWVLLIDDLDDAARGGARGTEALNERAPRRPVTQEELNRAKKQAAAVGRMGEELVNAYLQAQVEAGELQSFVWASNANAVSPFDFESRGSRGNYTLIEVKSTHGAHEQPIHLSSGELEKARASSNYLLYRVSEVDSRGERAVLKIAKLAAPFLESLIGCLTSLPNGVRVDSFSLEPELLVWSPPIPLALPSH